ncbi:CDGSH iron-sulfur domain-containing protein 2 [Branchiostoma belcheri]|nr:CDGSH iron-sulfur domain-containing protein 2 [Branchiostoma belcheri]
MAGVQPFRFEPQTDSSGDSEPDPGDDNVWDGGDVETERWRLGNRDWCRCGNEDNRNCLEMPSVRESVCCHDLPELTDTEKNVGTDHPCIRNHPDFDVILHPANLRTLLIFRWDLIRQGVQEPVSNILFTRLFLMLTNHLCSLSWSFGNLWKLTPRSFDAGPYQQPQRAQRGILAASYVLADRLKWRTLQICSNETFYVTDSVAAPPSGQSGASRETSIGGTVAAAVYMSLKPYMDKKDQKDQLVNLRIQKESSKVVNMADIEDLGNKVCYCRCWRSKKFPLCDGSHAKHNEDTGDNVGPLVLKRKDDLLPRPQDLLPRPPVAMPNRFITDCHPLKCARHKAGAVYQQDGTQCYTRNRWLQKEAAHNTAENPLYVREWRSAVLVVIPTPTIPHPLPGSPNLGDIPISANLHVVKISID